MKTAWNLVLAGATVTLLLPVTAEASCVLPPPMRRAMAGAPAVFVGTVTAVRYDGRWATVSVGEIWKGEGLRPPVEVRSGVGSPNTRSSVDRVYEIGQTYLFVPYERNGSVLRDNACTRTTRFTNRVARFRPDTISVPLPSDPAPTTPAPLPSDPAPTTPAPTTWLIAGASLLALLAVVYLVLRVARRD